MTLKPCTCSCTIDTFYTLKIAHHDGVRWWCDACTRASTLFRLIMAMKRSVEILRENVALADDLFMRKVHQHQSFSHFLNTYIYYCGCLLLLLFNNNGWMCAHELFDMRLKEISTNWIWWMKNELGTIRKTDDSIFCFPLIHTFLCIINIRNWGGVGRLNGWKLNFSWL